MIASLFCIGIMLMPSASAWTVHGTITPTDGYKWTSEWYEKNGLGDVYYVRHVSCSYQGYFDWYHHAAAYLGNVRMHGQVAMANPEYIYVYDKTVYVTASWYFDKIDLWTTYPSNSVRLFMEIKIVKVGYETVFDKTEEIAKSDWSRYTAYDLTKSLTVEGVWFESGYPYRISAIIQTDTYASGSLFNPTDAYAEITGHIVNIQYGW